MLFLMFFQVLNIFCFNVQYFQTKISRSYTIQLHTLLTYLFLCRCRYSALSLCISKQICCFFLCFLPLLFFLFLTLFKDVVFS